MIHVRLDKRTTMARPSVAQAIALDAKKQAQQLAKCMGLNPHIVILTPDDVLAEGAAPAANITQAVPAKVRQNARFTDLVQTTQQHVADATSMIFPLWAEPDDTFYGIVVMGNAGRTTREVLAQTSALATPQQLSTPEPGFNLDDLSHIDPTRVRPDQTYSRADEMYFSVYHELGHVLHFAWQDELEDEEHQFCTYKATKLSHHYGDTPERVKKLLKGLEIEGFADTFGALMYIHQTGDVSLVKDIADSRVLGLRHYGGAAARYITFPALDRVVTLAEAGKLPTDPVALFQLGRKILQDPAVNTAALDTVYAFREDGNMAAGKAFRDRVAVAEQRLLAPYAAPVEEAEVDAMLALHNPSTRAQLMQQRGIGQTPPTAPQAPQHDPAPQR